MSSLDIDFQRVMARANSLSDAAERIKNLSDNKYGTVLQDIAGFWKGENAEAYLNKGRTVQTGLKESAGELESIAQEIKAAAQRIYDAEMKNREIAEKRTY